MVKVGMGWDGNFGWEYAMSCIGGGEVGNTGMMVDEMKKRLGIICYVRCPDAEMNANCKYICSARVHCSTEV